MEQLKKCTSHNMPQPCYSCRLENIVSEIDSRAQAKRLNCDASKAIIILMTRLADRVHNHKATRKDVIDSKDFILEQISQIKRQMDQNRNGVEL